MTKTLAITAKRTAVLFVSFPLFLLAETLFFYLFEALYKNLFKYFPTAFPLYNPIFEGELYDKYLLSISLLAILAASDFTVYFTLRYDNARGEYFISRTEGFFRVKDEIKPYLIRYGLSDVIGSVFFAAVIVLPTAFIPDVFLRSDNIIAEILRVNTTAAFAIGDIRLAVNILFSFLIAHLPSVPYALSYYRAKWLTGFVE